MFFLVSESHVKMKYYLCTKIYMINTGFFTQHFHRKRFKQTSPLPLSDAHSFQRQQTNRATASMGRNSGLKTLRHSLCACGQMYLPEKTEEDIRVSTTASQYLAHLWVDIFSLQISERRISRKTLDLTYLQRPESKYFHLTFWARDSKKRKNEEKVLCSYVSSNFKH